MCSLCSQSGAQRATILVARVSLLLEVQWPDERASGSEFDDEYIGVKAWKAKFPISPENTERAFLRFTGWPNMVSMERAIAEENRKKKMNRRFFDVLEGFGDFADKQIKEFAV
jgi:hypothetical protein